MPKAVFYVETRPSSPDREDEYNRWYDEVHLREVCALPGFTGARRFRSDDGGYVAIYDVEVDDLSSVMTTFGQAVADGRIQMTDALQLDPPPVTRLLEQTSSYPA